MTEEQWRRWVQWRYRHMSFAGQVAYIWRMRRAHARGRLLQFIRRDARALDKAVTTSYNELQRRAAQ